MSSDSLNIVIMPNGLIRRLVIFGALSIMGIVLIQGYWLQRTFSLKDSEFNQTVTIALYEVAQKIASFNEAELPKSNLIQRQSSNIYAVNINDNIDAIQSNSTHYLDNGTWRRRNLLRTNDDGRKLAVTDSPWTGGDIHHAAGRLVFTKDGNDYLCSATAIKDGSMANGRSIIVTAGHCVYDDATKKVRHKVFYIICSLLSC